MARQWTEAQKARQAELIRSLQPWKQSTGPRTPEGKKVSAQNAVDVWVRDLRRRLGMSG